MSGIVKLHRVLKATPEKIYRAFLESEARVKWLPPHGFTGQIQHSAAKVGGTYKMSFTNFTTGQKHSFGGKYTELVPGQRIGGFHYFAFAGMRVGAEGCLSGGEGDVRA